MTAKRGTGSAFTTLGNVKRREGAGWVAVEFGKRWDGSQWVQFWPPYVVGVQLTFNLDESPDTSGYTFNLTKAPQT